MFGCNEKLKILLFVSGVGISIGWFAFFRRPKNPPKKRDKGQQTEEDWKYDEEIESSSKQNFNEIHKLEVDTEDELTKCCTEEQLCLENNFLGINVISKFQKSQSETGKDENYSQNEDSSTVPKKLSHHLSSQDTESISVDQSIKLLIETSSATPINHSTVPSISFSTHPTVNLSHSCHHNNFDDTSNPEDFGTINSYFEESWPHFRGEDSGDDKDLTHEGVSYSDLKRLEEWDLEEDSPRLAPPSTTFPTIATSSITSPQLVTSPTTVSSFIMSPYHLTIVTPSSSKASFSDSHLPIHSSSTHQPSPNPLTSYTSSAQPLLHYQSPINLSSPLLPPNSHSTPNIQALNKNAP